MWTGFISFIVKWTPQTFDCICKQGMMLGMQLRDGPTNSCVKVMHQSFFNPLIKGKLMSLEEKIAELMSCWPITSKVLYKNLILQEIHVKRQKIQCKLLAACKGEPSHSLGLNHLINQSVWRHLVFKLWKATCWYLQPFERWRWRYHVPWTTVLVPLRWIN